MEKYDINSNTSYILGISLIIEALLYKAKYVNEVYLSSKANKNKELDKLLELCEFYNIKVIEDDHIIERLSNKENCYGIARFKKYQCEYIDDKQLVLYGFKNEGELGTILRSAVSFNFKDIAIVNSDIDIFSPKTIRASMGSFFHLNIKTFGNLNDYFKTNKNHIYPFLNSGKYELNSIKLIKPYSIIIPQDYHELENHFIDTYYLKHHDIKDVSLTTLSSIVFNYAYHQSVSDNNNAYKAQK